MISFSAIGAGLSALIARLGLGAIAHAVGGFLFDTKIGRVLLSGALCAALFTGWLWRHDAKIESAAAEKIDKAGRTLVKDAIRARRSAARPGSWERLRKEYCRDCN